ncbi:MAG: hypothetical protein WCP11_02850 [Candidatus Saccharibacteria bacterium]
MENNPTENQSNLDVQQPIATSVTVPVVPIAANETVDKDLGIIAFVISIVAAIFVVILPGIFTLDQMLYDALTNGMMTLIVGGLFAVAAIVLSIIGLVKHRKKLFPVLTIIISVIVIIYGSISLIALVFLSLFTGNLKPFI